MTQANATRPMARILCRVDGGQIDWGADVAAAHRGKERTGPVYWLQPNGDDVSIPLLVPFEDPLNFEVVAGIVS